MTILLENILDKIEDSKENEKLVYSQPRPFDIDHPAVIAAGNLLGEFLIRLNNRIPHEFDYEHFRDLFRDREVYLES